MRAIASCLPLLLLLLGGCARKLPGPDECRAFALAAVGVRPGTPASLLASQPRLEESAEKLTHECLTSPWDYELLNCLGAGQSSRLCTATFRARRAGAVGP